MQYLHVFANDSQLISITLDTFRGNDFAALSSAMACRSFDELHFGIVGYCNKRQPLALPCWSGPESGPGVSAKQPRVAIIGAGAAGLATGRS